MVDYESYLRLFPGALEEDLVKITYQAIYGPRHILQDKEKAYRELVNEWKGARDKKGTPSFVLIAPDVFQVNLSSFATEKELRDFFKAIEDSCVLFSQSSAEFNSEIERLCALIAEKELNLSVSRIRNLAAQRKPLAHSATFKRLYNPHYRVIKGKYFG